MGSEVSVEKLEWVEDARGAALGIGPSFDAALPWSRSFMRQPYYRVYTWKDAWSYERPNHPDLDALSGVASTLDEAKARCEADFIVVSRLHRWHLYMCANEPPA